MSKIGHNICRKICQQCHARPGAATSEPVCPACGGTWIDDPAPAEQQASEAQSPMPETLDHRGLVLPARHAVGGIITPW